MQDTLSLTQHFDQRISLMIDLGFRESGIDALRSYIELLWKSNDELNLISRKMTPADLIDNHLVDCLLPLKHFPSAVGYAADFGAGGGLPGVLYALQFPAIKYRLYEKSPLKRDFLNRCVELAPNLEIHGDIPIELRLTQLVSARAFKPINVIIDVSHHYFKNGGKYFLLKGRRALIDEELALAKKKNKTLEAQVIKLDSPILDVERHLVLI